MTTEEKKKVAKKPAAKKAPAKKPAEAKKSVAKKAEAPKAEAKKETAKPAAKKPAAKKAAPTGATVTVRQIGSRIGRRKDQEATLIGLGLNKRNRVRTLKDTPEVRGMIYKVRHLVEVVNQ